jgi:hypothetical protein
MAMRRNEVFPSRWLKAPDCEPPIVATVDSCRFELVGQGANATNEPVLHFQGAVKPFILNQTNWDSMASISERDDSDDWTGIRIELYAVDVQGPSGMTRGVRIRRPTRPSVPAAPSARTTRAATTTTTPTDLGDAFETPADDEVGF